MVSIFLGIMIATLLMSAAPVYLDALERQSINSAVESSLARDGETYFSITTRSNFIPLEVPEIYRTGAALDQAIDASVAPIHTGTARHLRTPFYSVVLPDRPVADPPEGASDEDGEDEDEEDPPREPAEGFVQSFTGLYDHITVIEGRLAEDTVLRGTQGPMVEVLVSGMTAAEFGDLVPRRRSRRRALAGRAGQGLGQDSRADRGYRPRRPLLAERRRVVPVPQDTERRG